jgi:uncharacterized membrane protein YhhN
LNDIAWSWLAIALLFAFADWYAVAARRVVLEYVCKPATTLALLAAAIALDPTHRDTRVWLCVALGFCAAGDVFLMLPRDAFVPGLASFLVAHVCIATGYALHVTSVLAVVVGAATVAIVAAPLAYRDARALLQHGRGALVGPVLAYVGAISVMVVTAIASGIVLAAAGAGLFFASDALIGESRFVRPRAWAPVTIMVTYHVALAALVLSLAE